MKIKKKKVKVKRIPKKKKLPKAKKVFIKAKKSKSVKAVKKPVKKKKVLKRSVKRIAKKKSSAKTKARKKVAKIKKKTPKPRRTLAIKKIIKKKQPPRAFKASRPKEDFPAESFFKAKIKVIGIGGGGGSIVSEIGRSLNKATFVIADTDMRAFKKRSGIKYFLFGQELTHGLGTGLNPVLARIAAEQEKDRIAKLFEDQDIVIFIASLGGGLGSGATKVFAETLKDFGGITFGIFTLPFKFEGKHKYKIAYKALRELRKSLNVSITIPNERIFKIIDSNTAITEAFSIVNKNLIGSLESLIDLIYNPGVINIDFADLRAILRGKGNLAFLNTAEVSGKDRVEKISQEILYNPLYQSNNFIAEKILFNIAGSGSLSMLEVDKISSAIAKTNPKAKIIFGISKNAKYKNKIKATLLMTGSPSIADVLVAKEEAKPASVRRSFSEGDLKIEKKKAKSSPAKAKKKPAVKKEPAPTEKSEELTPLLEPLTPVGFNVVPLDAGLKKLNIIDAAADPALNSAVADQPKKTIRRTALEIKKAQDSEENKKTRQEEEWEIPAFLRVKK
ncbi:MAG: hypothetical protein A3A98_01995 [Candidatus Staskawiczbacteria bacterium RIFCSPLOWO2_01_FULL_40_39]|uniref:Cell division protein FtsZ n=1 Tax=Candidatus Staskawiczbacteria bacterium RIFCSPHIGHO2_01_FULL_39_25 TaxID=1802202 RepID=A0A1G2HR76_9BACT|nr:MAG: hypothetical protein A2730_02150 [Candidatus Staskawiczbacteria bacterium RIFCSPHIGHO2_01_FULL_39_25]OGZ72738.1 MAG: hypothetical protein A3A98_01995 [Candidatus Staskawiczbacteria bacterium RIFCSPLOWO2_01_FULL_40_39]